MASRKKQARRAGGDFCSGIACRNARNKQECKNLSFFLFPRDDDRCRKWVQNTRRQDLLSKTAAELNKAGYKLCAVHFEPKQFTVPEEKKRLNWNAVPTLFNVPNPPPKVSKHTVVCSRHFRPEDFKWTPVQKKLKKDAVPSVFAWSSQSAVDGQPHADVQDGNSSAKGDSVTTRSRQRDVCCVKGCSTQRPEEGSVKKTFYPFPREDARCKQWIKNCNRQALMEKSPIQLHFQGFRVCSDHFEDGQFQYSAGPSFQRLVPDAVPTLFQRSRRPGSKASKKPKETPRTKPGASSGGQLQVKVSSLIESKSVAHQNLMDFENAEQTPGIKLEIDYAEDPTIHWTTPNVVAEESPEGGGDGETATTVQSLTAAAHIKVEPMDTHADTVPVHTPPPHTDTVPVHTPPPHTDTVPVHTPPPHTDTVTVHTPHPHTDREPQDIKTEPQDKTESQDIKTEPQDIKIEPQDIRHKPLQLNTVPVNTRPEPLDIKPEPVFFEERVTGSGSSSPMPDDQTALVASPAGARCDERTGLFDAFSDTRSPAPSLAEIEHRIKKEPVDREEHCSRARSVDQPFRY